MIITPRFYLKRPSAIGTTRIMLVLRFKKQLLKYGTGKSVFPELWDSDNQRPTTDRSLIKKHAINKVDLENIKIRLDNYEAETKRIFQYLDRQNIKVTSKIVREELDKAFEKDQFVPTKDLSVAEYIETFLSEIESGQRLIPFSGKRYTQGTIKNFKGFFAQIKAYQKKKRKKLRFEDITTDFYDLFVQFFNSKDYSPNTIGRHIKNLKTIMRTAREEGFHKNNEFERKQFKTLKVDSPSIYLSEKE
ncbi:MAG: phage integrase SAM-like domain-containing protein, partial [Saprospiraceae bacterium]